MHGFAFGTEQLARTRFAVSPAHELVWSLVTLRKPRKAALHDRWRRAVRAEPEAVAPDGDRFALLFALTGGRRYLPDFLHPVPNRQRPDLPEQLAAVVATDPRVAVAQARRVGADTAALREFTARPRPGLRRLAEQMADYFAVALAPHWTRLRGIAEADIAHRAATATADGTAAMLRGLHPRVGWDERRLAVDIGGGGGSVVTGVRDTVLIPCCFAWPTVHPATEADPDITIAYPPRGVGRLWSPTSASDAGPVAALLGATRAAVLHLLEAAHSTGEIAQALDISPATASHHLRVLRDAGLAAADRDGRTVRYRRTGLGDAVAG